MTRKMGAPQSGHVSSFASWMDCAISKPPLHFAQERAHENARLMLWLLERSLSDKASEVIRDNERIIDSMSDLLSSMDEMHVSTRMSEASSSVSSVVDEISSLEDDLVLYR